jgi:hypothetical protein
MTPIGILPIVRKREVDGTGTEIGAAKRRIDPEFLALGHARAMSTFKRRRHARLPTISQPMNIDLPERRVVITGMGVISPSGKDLGNLWSNVRGGVSAAAPVSRFDASKLPVKIAAEVKDFDVSKYIKSRKPGRFDLTIQYGVAAATLAVKTPGWI